MKPRRKNSKISFPPSPPSSTASHFTATLDETGKIIEMGYRGRLNNKMLTGAQRHCKNLVQLMLHAGRVLAEDRIRRAPPRTEIDLPEDALSARFAASVLRKKQKLAWFQTLFRRARNGGMPASDDPFAVAGAKISLRTSHANAPKIISVTHGEKTVNSDASSLEEFDELLATLDHTVRHVNYARALGDEVYFAAKKFRDSLFEHGYPDTDPFHYTQHSLNEVESSDWTCLDMHMMSLIPPTGWYRNDDWLQHLNRIRELAEHAGNNNPHRRQRRIHALDKTLLANPVELILLTDLILYDLSHFVESRVLTIDRSTVSWDSGIPSVDGILLLDDGIFSNGAGIYKVIVSDILPFGLTAPRDFRIFVFPAGDTQSLYYFIRDNWHKAWWGGTQGASLIYYVDLLERVRDLPEDCDVSALPPLLFFGNGLQKELQTIRESARVMLNSAEVSDGKLDENKFKCWFEKHGSKRVRRLCIATNL